MPFTVTPVKEVEIGFDEVAVGDHLTLRLEDNSLIVLTAAPNPRHAANPFKLVLEFEFLPYAGYLAVHENAAKIIRQQFYDMRKWYEGLETPGNLYDELLSAMIDDEPATAHKLQIGELPMFYFGLPFHLSDQGVDLTKWQPDSPIKSIDAATSWEATIEAGKIRAERELRALRVR